MIETKPGGKYRAKTIMRLGGNPHPFVADVTIIVGPSGTTARIAWPPALASRLRQVPLGDFTDIEPV